MRSWSASLLRSVLGCALFAAPLAIGTIAADPSVAAAQASAPSLDALLASFRSVTGLELRFREEKRIALMRTPAVSEGTIHYARPGRLARRVTRPSPQTVLIDGDELRMSDGRTVERIDLASQPVVRSFVDTFSRLLAGDRAALEQIYRVEMLLGEGASWTLRLTPRASPLDRFLRDIRFEGEGTALRSMVMTEQSGDTTTTTFSDVNTSRRFTPQEAATIFAL